MQQCVYETNICDNNDLQARFAQTWVDFEQNVIKAVIDKRRDSLRSCVRAGGGHFEHMFIYMIHQNILRNCQCNLMHVMAMF